VLIVTGSTCIHEASRLHAYEVLDTLLSEPIVAEKCQTSASQLVSTVNNIGQTCLHVACASVANQEEGNSEASVKTIEVLLKYVDDATLLLKDLKNQTAFDYLKQAKSNTTNNDAIKLLKKKTQQEAGEDNLNGSAKVNSQSTANMQQAILSNDISLESIAKLLISAPSSSTWATSTSTSFPLSKFEHNSVVVIMGRRAGSAAELERRMLGNPQVKGLIPGMLGCEELRPSELLNVSINTRS
jgi:hypothetical protein